MVPDRQGSAAHEILKIIESPLGYSLIHEKFDNREVWRLIILTRVSWCPIFGQNEPKIQNGLHCP